MKKKILTFCVVFVMLFAQIAMVISGIENSTGSESKITESLASEMNSYSDDEYIPIYVYLHDYGDTLVYSCLSQRLGTEINSENEGMYVSACIAEKQEMMRTEETEMQTTQISTSAGLQSVIDTASTKASFMREIGAISEVMSNEEIVGMIEAGKTYNEIITVSEKMNFCPNGAVQETLSTKV